MQEAKTTSMYELDLISAAWGWTQDEVAAALGVRAEQLRAWRIHEMPVQADVAARMTLFHQVHIALWRVLAPGAYARWWRQSDRGFGGKSPIQVALEDAAGLEKVLQSAASAIW